MNTQQFDAKTSRRPIERFQWPLGAALFLVSTAFLFGDTRRSPRKPAGPEKKARIPESPIAGAALFAVLYLGTLNGLYAKNQAVEAYERKDYKSSADNFRSQLHLQPHSLPLHFGLGTAAYQSGDYETALQEFSQASISEDPKLRQFSEYNLGNTLYQRGVAQQKPEDKLAEWRNAIQHYEQSLQIAPEDPRTLKNLGTVRKRIEELEKQQEQQQKQQGNQDQKEKQDSDSSKDQKDSGTPQDSDSEKDSSKENQQEKPEDGKQGQKEGKPSEDSKKQSPQSSSEERDSQPQKPEQKPEGDLRNKPQFGEDQKTRDAKEEADNAQAAAEGKMTPQQAKSLIESLRSEDQRVQLIEKNRIQKGRILRDW